LRHRIAVHAALADDRRRACAQTSHAEEEQIHGIGDQRQAKHHRKDPRPQQQVNAAGGEHPQGNGEQRLHQTTSPLVSSWLTWPRLERINKVAPITVRYTPRSNSSAVASSTSPSNGMLKWPKLEVRNG